MSLPQKLSRACRRIPRYPHTELDATYTPFLIILQLYLWLLRVRLSASRHLLSCLRQPLRVVVRAPHNRDGAQTGKETTMLAHESSRSHTLFPMIGARVTAPFVCLPQLEQR